MPYLNRYSFIGHLTKTPELRFQATGDKKALCLLNVAINRDSKDEIGEKISHTTFINDIEVWGASGEACATYLTTGSMVLVEGRMDVDQWQDKLSGSKRSRLKVVAETVQFLKIKNLDDEMASPFASQVADPCPSEAPAGSPETSEPAAKGRKRPSRTVRAEA